jgi:hypothetical protein
MNSLPFNPNLSETEALFESEREIALEPDERRIRAVQRARASLPRIQRLRREARSTVPRRVGLRELAASALLLSGLCPAAFFAGYMSSSGNVESRAAAHATASSGVAPSVSGAFSATPVTNSGNLRADTLAAKLKSALAARSTTENESYDLELRLLQPARQAAAEQEYVSVLRAVAEHQHRFPSGKLAEEREALRVKALFGLGRLAEAQRAGADFCEHFPNSALIEPIDEITCPRVGRRFSGPTWNRRANSSYPELRDK